MAKIRVHEIAKELGIPSREMVEKLQHMGLDIKNHMSTLEESQANWVKKQLEIKNGGKDDTPVIKKGPTPESRAQVSAGENQANVAKNLQARGEQQQLQEGTKKPTPRTEKRNKGQGGSSVKANERTPSQGERVNISQAKTEKEHLKGQPKPHNREIYRGSDKHAHRGSSKGQQKPAEKNNQNSRNNGATLLHHPPRDNRPVFWEKRHVSYNKAVEKEKEDFRNSNKYDKNKSKKSVPVEFSKDYSRPSKKNKHKQKKGEVQIQLPDVISIGDSITVRELAEMLHLSSADIVKKLMELGTMASINQTIDFDTAEIVASLYEVKVERIISEEEKLLEEIVDDESSLKPRPPIVTVMGHVDHGKTSLLDKIRKSDVVSGEAGGITQHIGAYQVTVNDNRITFIDTPGHEAFTAMRARGANLTDIVVLVVAADDGVMPQTVEAINHIKAANVPFLVAINKIDKPTANPDKVMQQLTEYGIVPEEWGGDTIFVPVSAKNGYGIDNLLEMILLLAEINEIKANPDREAEGVVLEGQLDRGRGPVATVLVLKGTLNVGDSIICGDNYCKVRAMTDHKGRRVQQAFPSMPVEITGWSDVPEAGEKIRVCDEKVAKEIVNLRLSEKKLEEQKKISKVSLDDFFKHMQNAEVKELNLIVKGDVQGSIEALTQSLLRLATDEVKVNIIHSAVGAISETDVMLASASQAIIIGFNVRPDVKARKYAEDEGIDVRLYRVIYEAIDDVKKAMAGLLEPEYKEKYIGRAEVRATFKVPNVGVIAGSYVIDGKMQRNANVRVLRDGVIVYEGKLSSLKRYKDDVRVVVENYECGIGIQDFNDVKEGDIIEAYTMEEIPREL